MRARALLASLALAATVTAAACSSNDVQGAKAGAEPRARAPAATTTTIAAAVPATPATGSPVVAVLGDSNTYFAISELEASFREAGWQSTIRGIPGSGLKDLERDWESAAAMIAAYPPAVVVVALGTNDASGELFVADFRARIDRLVDGLGDVPVVWVTHTEGGAQHAAAAERAVNDEIRAAATRHPNLTILDLAPAIDRDATLLAADGLHFSPSGEAWFADRIAEAIGGVGQSQGA